MRAATAGELAEWDSLLQQNPDGGHILQTHAWGQFKARWGWDPVHLIGEAAGRRVAVLMLRRPIRGLGDLWYSPKGPGVTDTAALVSLLGDREALSGGFLAKLEPEILRAECDLNQLRRVGITKPPLDIQIHSATVVVSLVPSEEALLTSFRSKTRYNIRLAARKGVRVRQVPVTARSLDAMYRLMVLTSRRADFPLRRRAYFEDYWITQAQAAQGSLYFAQLDDEVLAGAFVTSLGKRAWYKDGGSTKRHSELMAPYLLQWEIMRDLRRRGVTSYDLVAVPRTAELTASHPMHGLWRFKSGFNDRITEYVGTVDLTLSPGRARVFNRLGERLAVRYQAVRRRDLLY
ncbi:MAG: peptidoglycan bridge formation glycyltransferase FemA/FemB family protein [Candidatus Dormibacteria bacterium]